MSVNRENVAIEDYLHDRNFRTERSGDVVNVWVPGKNQGDFSLQEIRTIVDAIKFVAETERSKVCLS